MKIVVKNAYENPVVKEIEGELNEMQEIVGGYIECFPMTDDILCVCNEEGKILGLPINFNFNRAYICGNVFFVASGCEEFESLTDEQVYTIMEVFEE